jgi:hypothetical protein
MNQPLFWAFLITFFFSFDAAVINIYAGSIAFFGSIIGAAATAIISTQPETKK